MLSFELDPTFKSFLLGDPCSIHISQEGSNQSDDVANPAFETALEEVREICEARLRYNKALLEYCQNNPEEEVRKYLTRIAYPFIGNSSASFTELKKELFRRIEGDLESYQAAIALFKGKPRNQELVDALYEFFIIRYEHEKAVDLQWQTSKKIKEKRHKTDPNFYEKRFFLNISNILNILISKEEIDYLADHELTITVTNHGSSELRFYPNNRFKTKYLQTTQQYDKASTILHKKYLHFREAFPQLNGKDIDFQRIRNNVEELIRILQQALGGGEYNRDRYLELRKKSIILKRDHDELARIVSSLQKVIQDSVAAAEKKAAEKKKQEAQTKAKKHYKFEGTHKPEEINVVTPTIEAKEELRPSESNPALTVELSDTYRQEKELLTQQYHETVARARQEKEELKALEKKQKAAERQEQLKSEQQQLAEKEEKDLATVFELLSNVNNSNLSLLELMLGKPTPHNKIRYQEIESLFGQEKGKLKGTITGAGGSHRQIRIGKTLGFFDAVLNDSNQNAESQEVVGGTFKAHKKGHSAKLPSIAISMICSPLALAGITEENLQIFREAKFEFESIEKLEQEKLLQAAKIN